MVGYRGPEPANEQPHPARNSPPTTRPPCPPASAACAHTAHLSGPSPNFSSVSPVPTPASRPTLTPTPTPTRQDLPSHMSGPLGSSATPSTPPALRPPPASALPACASNPCTPRRPPQPQPHLASLQWQALGEEGVDVPTTLQCARHAQAATAGCLQRCAAGGPVPFRGPEHTGVLCAQGRCCVPGGAGPCRGIAPRGWDPTGPATLPPSNPRRLPAVLGPP